MRTSQQPTEKRQVAPISALGDCSQRILDELEAVVDEIDRFVQDFCERFEGSIERFSTFPANFADSAGTADSLDDLESSRQQAEQGIREQMELLTLAWLRLEDEQRALLQSKQGLANLNDGGRRLDRADPTSRFSETYSCR